jgi:hypothetical protein
VTSEEPCQRVASAAPKVSGWLSGVQVRTQRAAELPGCCEGTDYRFYSCAGNEYAGFQWPCWCRGRFQQPRAGSSE